MSRHGGARSGSGRPRKWSFDDMLAIGHACETRWLAACDIARVARLAALPHADKIRALQEGAQAIPLWQREAWLASEANEDHSGDIEAWLHSRAGTQFNEQSGDYEGEAPRVVTVSTRPPRGTRKRIIGEVSVESGLSESAVDNLWQTYRRFRAEESKSAET